MAAPPEACRQTCFAGDRLAHVLAPSPRHETPPSRYADPSVGSTPQLAIDRYQSSYPFLLAANKYLVVAKVIFCSHLYSTSCQIAAICSFHSTTFRLHAPEYCGIAATPSAARSPQVRLCPELFLEAPVTVPTGKENHGLTIATMAEDKILVLAIFARARYGPALGTTPALLQPVRNGPATPSDDAGVPPCHIAHPVPLTPANRTSATLCR